MSNALAIAGVTAVLQSTLRSLHDTFLELGLAPDITAVAPEEVNQKPDAKPCLNLFLYQVTPNSGWRNFDLASRDSAGNRVASPPLALDLHYLMTAYGSGDLQAEVLLGYGMLAFHETPVLTREQIRSVLHPTNPPPPHSIHKGLETTGLADQIEQIKITLAAMNSEELSKLWTALQARYRPTASYLATVVLIEPRQPSYSALPVLSRGPVDPVTHLDHGAFVQTGLVNPVPEITAFVFPGERLVAWLGHDIEVQGFNLDGTDHQLRLTNARHDINQTLEPPTSVTPTSVHFTLPDDAANIPAGTYAAELQLTRAMLPGEDPAQRLSNALPLTIAPQIESLPATAHLDGNGDLTVALTCKPLLRPEQRVSLLLGGIEALAEPFDTSTDSANFAFRAIPVGKYRARLRVDGVDSVIIDRAATPPGFIGPELEVLP